MLMKLNYERVKITPRHVGHSFGAVGLPYMRTPTRRTTRAVTDDEELELVKKYVFALALVGIAPLSLFLTVHYFFPDLLLFLAHFART